MRGTSRKPAALSPRKTTRNGKTVWEAYIPGELAKSEGCKRRFFDKESVAAALYSRLKGDLIRYSDKA